MKTHIKILLVEDFKIIRKAQKKILEQLGYQQIIEADDGEHAIRVLEQTDDIDLIISDWNMPKKDGYALLEWVRIHPTYQKVPFIMVTAQGEKQMAEKAYRIGVTAFITKPFTQEELKSSIQAAFDEVSIKKEAPIRTRKVSGKTEIKVAHIQITDHLALGVLNHLIQQGEFTPKYFELQISCMPSWNLVQRSLEQNQVDAAFALAPICMDLFGANVPIRLVLFAHKNGSICVRTKMTAESKPLHEYLKGKIILLPHILSVHHMLVDMFLREIGLRLGPVGKKNVDVFYEVVPPIDMPKYLSDTPNAFGFVVAEPIGKKSIQNGISDRLFLSGEIWENHPCCVVVFQKDFIDRQPDAVAEFVELLVKSGQFISKHPDTSAEIGRHFLDPTQQLGLTKQVIESILREPKGVKTNDLMPVIDDLEKIQRYMTQIMGIGKLIDLEKFVDLRFAESACRKWKTPERPSVIQDPSNILTQLITKQMTLTDQASKERFQMEQNDSSISFVISSDMSLVDRLVNYAHDFIKQFGYDVFSEFRIVLRELLINAVEHGNKNIPHKTVTCNITKLDDSIFKITVIDEGEGFDYSQIDMSISKDMNQVRHRGLAIIKSFSKKVEFNPKGNQVSAYLQLHKKTYFDVTQDHQWIIFKPSGDITASVADAFRTLLNEYVEKGFTKFKFDFINVRDMDSVSLSILIVLNKILSAKNPKLEIIHVCEDLYDLFRMTQIDKTYRITKNE